MCKVSTIHIACVCSVDKSAECQMFCFPKQFPNTIYDICSWSWTLLLLSNPLQLHVVSRMSPPPLNTLGSVSCCWAPLHVSVGWRRAPRVAGGPLLEGPQAHGSGKQIPCFNRYFKSSWLHSQITHLMFLFIVVFLPEISNTTGSYFLSDKGIYFQSHK